MWTGHDGGTCWLKDGGETLFGDSVFCGEVVNRAPTKSNTQTGTDSIHTASGQDIPVNCRRLQATFICREN